MAFKYYLLTPFSILKENSHIKISVNGLLLARQYSLILIKKKSKKNTYAQQSRNLTLELAFSLRG